MSSKTIIQLTKDVVQFVDLTHLQDHIAWIPQHAMFFMDQAGKEPYKLLACISKQLPPGSIVSDIGTLYGSSALALSVNESIEVHTYDVTSDIPNTTGLKTVLHRPNVKMTVVSAQAVLSKIATSDLISLDINTADGQEELKIIHKLAEFGFRGMLVLDDIHLNAVMENVWNKIPSHVKKIDVTEMGHWSGTGLLIYDEDFISVEVV